MQWPNRRRILLNKHPDSALFVAPSRTGLGTNILHNHRHQTSIAPQLALLSRNILLGSLYYLSTLHGRTHIFQLTCITFDGCREVKRQAPLLEFYTLKLPWMRRFSFIPRIAVKHMHLQALRLILFTSELLCGFLDALELPSLEAYCYHAVARRP